MTRWKGAAQRDAWTALVEGKSQEQTTPQSKPKSNRSFALGRLKPGEMNRTEAAYGEHLASLQAREIVLWYTFEGMTFKLAEGVRLTPDFNVLYSDGRLVCVDVKGTTTKKRASGEKVKAAYIMDDARVKMRVAAQKFPIVFNVAYKVAGEWVEEEY